MLCGPLSSTLSILRSSLNFLHSPLHISLPSAHPALPRSNNPYVVVIALDFTKAFDTVLHETLLHKLAQLNIPPPKFSGFTSVFLPITASDSRRFRVHMGSDVSSWRFQRNGLPQGSVLAPVLFNLYTNDLPVTHSRKFIYADDMNLAAQFSELECSLSADLARMSHYCRQWHLKPSAPKTVASCFHLHNATASRQLSVWLNRQRIKYDHQPTFLDSTVRSPSNPT